MFFVLSKIFWFFVQPLNLAIFLLAAGLVGGAFGRVRLMTAAMAGAFLVLALATWTSLGQMLLSPLETRFVRPELPARVDGIIVLGGGLEGAINLARGGYELNAGGDRYVEAAILARRFPDARIVVSGGTGTLILEGEGDGATRAAAADRAGYLGRPPGARQRVPRHLRKRGLYQAPRIPAARPDLAAGHLGLPYAARHGAVPQGGFPCSAVAGRLPHHRARGRRPVRRQSDRFAAGDDHRAARVDRPFRLLADRPYRPAVP